MVRNHKAVSVYFHTVINPISGFLILAVRDAEKRAIHGSAVPVVLIGSAYPVRLYQVEAQGVGVPRRGTAPLEQHEAVPAHEP